jgi:hypothetical protein
VTNGIWKFINRSSGQAMQVGTGNNVDQAASTAGFNQFWDVTDLGGGKTRLIGLGSSKALDVSGGSTADGANVIVWTSTGSANQQFTFTATTSGYYRMTPVHSGKCVAVSGLDTTQPNNVDQRTYTGVTNQQWLFQSVQ